MTHALDFTAPSRLAVSLGLTLAMLSGCDESTNVTPSEPDALLDAMMADAIADMVRADAGELDAAPDPDVEPVPDLAVDMAVDAAPPLCGPVLRFDPMGDDWLRTPWPSDTRRTADGAPDLDDVPFPRIALVDPYREVGAGLSGFGLNGAVYADFDAPLDPTSLPTPEDTLGDDPAISLHIMTGPRAGERIALEVGLPAAADRWVEVDTVMTRPVPGYVLPQGEQVCALFTGALRGLDGCPAQADVAFAAALRDDPSLSVLRESGLSLDGVIGAACYTTGNPTQAVEQVIADARSMAAPTVRMISSERFGGPDRVVYRVEYETPVYQVGEAPWREPGEGRLLFDADGRPQARMVTVGALVAVPDIEPPPDGVPVVQYAPGTGGEMTLCPTIARQRRGSDHAVACVDRPGVGERGAGEPAAWPDFINPHASLGMMGQEVVDHLVLSRVVARVAAGEVEGEIAPPSIAGGRPALLGFSQGALMAGLAAGLLPELDAVIIDSGGGLAIEGALVRPESGDVVEAFAPILGIAIENVQGLHPAVAVLQMLADPVDPINYAPRWFTDGGADVLVLSGMRDVRTQPPFAIALAAAAGVPQARPILGPSTVHSLLDIEPVDLPISANMGPASTGVLIQVDAGHGTRSEAGETMDHWLRSRLVGVPEAR